MMWEMQHFTCYNADELGKIGLLSVIVLTEQSCRCYIVVLMLKILDEINHADHVKQN